MRGPGRIPSPRPSGGLRVHHRPGLISPQLRNLRKRAMDGFDMGGIPALAEEHRMVRDLVVKFVERDLMPLEAAVLKRESEGQRYGLTPEEEGPLLKTCKELGLWGLDVPEEFGGADLPLAALMAIEEEMGRTVTPFLFPPDSPNLHMLKAVAQDDQRKRYLAPKARGEMRSSIAISEPGAGGDPAGMTTRAVR